MIYILLLIGFCVGSIFYVYHLRGQARFANAREYLRKGWPLFTPFNVLLYLFTQKRAGKPIMDLNDFPELLELQQHWREIQAEGLALHRADEFNRINQPGQAAHYDVGFRTFYKYGWRKFYLKWYGYNHASALRSCPKTVEILNRTKCVNGAMFSLLPPGGKLTRHLDPFACSLRYHLGLATPNSDDCFISIDDKLYSWRDGQSLLFDETYIHYARNDTDQPRLILMCDIDRPLHLPGRWLNALFKQFMKFSVVPNTEEDKRGGASQLLAWVEPIMARGKQLKRANRPLYNLIKYSINFVALSLLFGFMYTQVLLIDWLI